MSTDSSVLRYYQGRDNTRKEQMMTRLLGAMISQPYYEELRTNQQLGYIVQAGYANHARDPGIKLLVQSPKSSVEQIEKSNDIFIKQFADVLDKLTNTDLEAYRLPMIKKLMKVPASLSEEIEEFWAQIRQGYLRFDLSEKSIKTLKEISIADIKELYQEIVVDCPRAISVVAEGNKEKTTKLFTNYKRFQVQHAKDWPVWTAPSVH